MQEFHPQETQLPQTAPLPTTQTPLAAQTEAEAQTARLVTDRLNEITIRANRVKRRFVIGAVLLHSGVAALFCLTILFIDHRNPLALFFVAFTTLVHWISLALLYLAYSRMTPKFDAEEIGRLGGVKAVVPLFATLQATQSRKQKRAIQAALTTLLPQMKASDANLLTPTSRRLMQQWLATTTDACMINKYPDALRITALKALEQVGDSSDIPVVTLLTTMVRVDYRHAKVKQAAVECLPMLRAHCGNVETARSLLRASQSEDARPETLLRPVSGPANTASAELLRGADSPDAPPSDGRQA